MIRPFASFERRLSDLFMCHWICHCPYASISLVLALGSEGTGGSHGLCGVAPIALNRRSTTTCSSPCQTPARQA